MTRLLIKLGNFVFRWRDTLFPLIFLPSFYLLSRQGFAVGDFSVDLSASLVGFAVALTGVVVRMITIGYGFVTRSGVNKQIHAQKVQTRGLFAHTRNPLYLGNYLIVTGSIISINLFWYYAVVLPVFYIFYVAITLAEEEYLHNRLGEEYDRYKASVKNRFLPGQISRLGDSFKDMEFSWKRYFKREYSSTIIILGSLAIVHIVKLGRYGAPYLSGISLYLLVFLALAIVSVIITKYLSRTGRLEWNSAA